MCVQNWGSSPQGSKICWLHINKFHSCGNSTAIADKPICQRQLSFLFGNRKMWRCSQARCCSYLYSPSIVISFWNSSFLIIRIWHLALSNVTTDFRDTTKYGAGRICGVDRHSSVMITRLICILSLFPAVCIQQSATPTPKLTLILTNPNPNHIPNPNPNCNLQ